MKATLTKTAENARNMEPEKERVNTLRVVSRILGTDKGLQTVCEARFYMARRSDGASPVYCGLWVSGAQWTSGHGRASGYGYHKESAALQAAIDSAGIKLTGDNYRELSSVLWDYFRANGADTVDAIRKTASRELSRSIARRWFN